MSADVLTSSKFDLVYKTTPETKNYAGEGTAEGNRNGISQVASSVVSFIQTTNDEFDSEKIEGFVSKMGLINDQFSEASLGTPFSAAIFSINLLLDLRKNLGAHYGDLIADPFTLRVKALSEQESVENKVGVAAELHNYMENILIPALKNASSSEEVLILEPFVDQCMALYEKVTAETNNEALEMLHNTMATTYNAQLFRTENSFKFVSSYTDGKIPNLDSSEGRTKALRDLGGFVDSFISAAKTSVITTAEKINLYNKLVEIEKAFAAQEEGEAFSSLIEKLNQTFDIPEGMRSSYPIELAELTSGNKKTIAQELYAFQNGVLLPYLNGATTSAQIDSTASLVALCGKISDVLGSVDPKKVLENQKKDIAKLVQTKKVIEAPFFKSILNMTSEQLGDLGDSSRRAPVHSKVYAQVEEVIGVQDHPLFTEELKAQFFKSVEVVHQGFDAVGHGVLTASMVGDLRSAFGYPEPKKDVVAEKQPARALPPTPRRNVSSSPMNVGMPSGSKRSEETGVSKNFSNLRAMFDSSETKESVVPVRRSKSKKVETLEERKARAFITIQGLISGLDPQGIEFKSKLENIQGEIQLVKNKYPGKTTTDFEQLEKAVQLLRDPKELSVNFEEEMMLKKLASVHGISSVALGGYKGTTEARSLKESQKGVIKALKGAADSLEGLNAIAGKATTDIRAKAIQSRFEWFVVKNPMTPPLTNHIGTHFPRLVLMLENYIETLVVAKIEQTWGKMLRAYDSATEGAFSKVLSTYSGLDPEKYMPVIIEKAREAFLNGIDFGQVDGQARIDFDAYMKSIVAAKEIGSLPVRSFRRDYKAYVQSPHEWLADNVHYLKVPYNQGDNDSTNLGEGVCGANSLNRLGILAKNPDAPIESLTMGSTQQSRMVQTRTHHHFLAAEKGEMSIEKALEEQTSRSEEFGIVFKDEFPIENRTPNVHQNLVNQMIIHAKGGQTSFYVRLRAEGVGSHAVNVQIDPSRDIYRLMDDNIGLVDYPNEATFKQELGKYFAIFYPEFSTFAFLDFEAI